MLAFSAELASFEVSVALSNTKKATATVRGVMLELKKKDGEVAYRAPIQNDIDAEKLCEDIARRCRQAGK